MAVTLVKSPAYIAPAYNELIFVYSSTNSAKENFKYIFDVYINNTFAVRMKMSPDTTTGYGMIDVSKIVQSYIDNMTLNLADNKFTMINQQSATAYLKNVVNYNIKVGEEFVYDWPIFDAYWTGGGSVGFYATSEAHPFILGDYVTLTFNDAYPASYFGVHRIIGIASNTKIQVDGTNGYTTAYYNTGSARLTNGSASQFLNLSTSAQFYAFNGAVDKNRFNSFDYTQYNIGGTTANATPSAKFLTTSPNPHHNMKITDYSYLNFFHTQQYGAISCYISTYAKNSGEIFTGFERPQGIYLFQNQYMQSPYHSNLFTQVNRFMNLGVGPANLNKLTASNCTAQPYVALGIPSTFPIIKDNTFKYSVIIYKNGNKVASEFFTFYIDEECTGYDTKRLLFLDRLGSYVGVSFSVIDRYFIDNKKTTFKRNRAYLSSNNIWTYPTNLFEQTVLNSDVTESYVLNSNWVNDSMSEYIKELITSPIVYIQEIDGTLIPVIVNDSKQEIKTEANDHLFSYQIEVTKAYKNATQR